MIATNRFYTILAGLALLALLVAFLPVLSTPWWLLFAILLIVAAVDSVSVLRTNALEMRRTLPRSFPLDVPKQVSLHIANHSKRTLRLDVFDHHPEEIQTHDLPVSTTLQVGQHTQINYSATAIERGEINFSAIQCLVMSRLGLWKRSVKSFVSDDTNVYPNFTTVSKYLLLAMDNRLSQMGILKKQRRGEGLDFRQLREYRKGDPLRQIDWKATSRTQKLISREYQDERDQQIIFLIDCGHRMFTKDGQISHFDHTLNATLLLAYVALKQGDAVGMATFSGHNRWLPPFKGLAFIDRLLNQVFDLQPTRESPDYSTAVTQLLKRQKKRSLVIVISNVRDEDTDDLLPALNLLKRKHLVLLASMQEEAMHDTLNDTVQDVNDAIRVAAVHDYLQLRKTAFDKIRANGIRCVDVLPSQLSVQLVNSYLEIKASGKL